MYNPKLQFISLIYFDLILLWLSNKNHTQVLKLLKKANCKRTLQQISYTLNYKEREKW